MSDQPSPEGAAVTRRGETASGQSHLETAVDDVFGVDFKIGRTLRDSVLRPGRVADAALANDESRYTRPLKVYLALFALSSLVFVLAIWAMRPRLKLHKSFQLYLVASNATSVIAVPLVVAGIFLGQGMLIAASLAVMLVFFVYGGLVLHRRAADTAWGLCSRIAGLVAAMVPAIAGMLAISYATLEIAFERQTGLSRTELIAQARWAAGQSGPP